MKQKPSAKAPQKNQSSQTPTVRSQPADSQLAKPKLLNQLANALRLSGKSYRTEQTYVDWNKRFILYHNKRHPKEMGEPEIRAFMEYLMNDRNVAPSTRKVAFHAILFLYREVLQLELPPM